MGSEPRPGPRLVEVTPQAAGVRTIVLAYNETTDSDRALQRAAELAGFYGARVVVTSVTPLVVGAKLAEAGPGPELRRAERRLSEAGIDVDLVEAVGDIAEAIVEVSRRYDADMIVVGTRELTQVERLLGHSVSESVQRMARCDVLIVH